MKNVIFSILFLSLLGSCNSNQDVFLPQTDAVIENRAKGTTVRVTNLDNSVTTYDSPKIRVDQDAQNGFLITIDYGKISAFSVYALEVTVVEAEDELTIIQNPGQNEVTFTDRTQVVISEENNSYLKAVMSPTGNANGTSFIVIDEIDGF